MPPEGDEQRWARYYEFASGRNPRELMLQAMQRFGERGHFGGQAVDLGCGPGIQTLTLLGHGWRVLAVDYQAESIRRIESVVPQEAQARLQTQLASFEVVTLPKADLVWAGLSLPYCPKPHLDGLLAMIVDMLNSGGRFAGDFFAPRHAWASDEDITVLSVGEIKAAFETLSLELWREDEGERQTSQGIQQWHAYGAIYRKP